MTRTAAGFLGALVLVALAGGGTLLYLAAPGEPTGQPPNAVAQAAPVPAEAASEPTRGRDENEGRHASARAPVATDAAAALADARNESPATSFEGFATWLANLSIPELRGILDAVAARHPGVLISDVVCIDRPCQAVVDAADPAALQRFLMDAEQRFGGHAAATFDKRVLPDGAATVRTTLTIGLTQPRALRLVPALEAL